MLLKFYKYNKYNINMNYIKILNYIYQDINLLKITLNLFYKKQSRIYAFYL